MLQENFASHSDVRYAVDYRNSHVESKDSVGFDLCVLASSDHNIITYGSFGLWGALLSGGDVIAAKGTNNQTYSVVIIVTHFIYQIFIYLLYITSYISNDRFKWVENKPKISDCVWPCHCSNDVVFLQHDYWYMMAKLPNWNYIDSRDPNNVTLLTEIHDDWIEFWSHKPKMIFDKHPKYTLKRLK